jgi:hypothetical protein
LAELFARDALPFPDAFRTLVCTLFFFATRFFTALFMEDLPKTDLPTLPVSEEPTDRDSGLSLAAAQRHG